ncbi:MAG: TIGR03862 family flavoprotein [Bacteroidales bacterium]|nr:TIGR03862 family flavoprotein [Bacteroidales bacterium]
MERKQIIIVGGGPAGMMAAEILSLTHNVSIFEKEKNLGQKFLLAGKGGFNLTNHLQGDNLYEKYSPEGFLNKALSEFDTRALRQWFSAIGVATYVGSSGRVFPEKGITPIDVLNAIKAKLLKQGVQIYTQHEFVGFDNNRCITFIKQGQEIKHKADYILFGLGGASWPVTGSNGAWRSKFEEMGITVNPFQSSNCGINIHWSESIRQYHVGKPIKNIRLFTTDFEIKGEAMICDYGIEGNAVYPLVPSIRNMLNANIPAFFYIDFKPSISIEQLLQKTVGKTIMTKDYGQVFNLGTLELAIIKAYTTKENHLSLRGFIHSIKNLAIPVVSLRPVEEAISSIGGIDTKEVNDDFSLKKYPWIYTVGEMLDWDAPTGGFLLQACFSMGNYAANSILKKT